MFSEFDFTFASDKHQFKRKNVPIRITAIGSNTKEIFWCEKIRFRSELDSNDVQMHMDCESKTEISSTRSYQKVLFKTL